MKRRIVGISGWKRHGKDSAAKPLIADGLTLMKFADPVYDGLLALDPYVSTQRVPARPDLGEPTDGHRMVRLSELVATWGWDKVKEEYDEVRRLLQFYGTEAGRGIHGWDCWVDAAWRRAPEGDLVFTDVRFINEAQSIVDRGGEIWRVIRPGAPVPDADAHISETELNDWPFDAVLINERDLAWLEAEALKQLGWMGR